MEQKKEKWQVWRGDEGTVEIQEEETLIPSLSSNKTSGQTPKPLSSSESHIATLRPTSYTERKHIGQVL